MKALYSIILLLLMVVAGEAQESTFHVRTADKSNGIAFSYGCLGKHEDVYIDKNGNADFYWGDNKNPTSASFANDTVRVIMFKKYITRAYIDSLRQLYTTDNRCGYFMRILQDGRVVDGVIIDEAYLTGGLAVPQKLKVLVQLLKELNSKYSFPK